MIEPPTELRAALDATLAPYAPRTLAEAAHALSATYRRVATSAARQPARPRSASDPIDADDDTLEAPGDAIGQPMTALAVAAYAATRLPATFAAIAAALTQTRLRQPDWRPQSLLDAGTGTGAALWAALAVWPDLARATLLERDPQMLALGKRLAEATPATSHADWRQGDLRGSALWESVNVPANAPRRNKPGHAGVTPDGGYDLVTAAYVLSELRADEREALVAHLWGATGGALALVGPGTPIGFAHIRAARAQLIAAGATILAPCPHDGVCPMGAAGPLAATGGRPEASDAADRRDVALAAAATGNDRTRKNGSAGGDQRGAISQPGHFIAPGDWCHFAQRLARSRLHRQIKGGDLAYEDEKFSYVIAVRPTNPAVAPSACIGGRIVRHPQTRPGLVALEICAPGGLERRVITRKDRDAYRRARDLRWGDAVAPL